MDKGIEKRKYPRIDVKLPLSFREFYNGSADKISESRSLNISQEGLCMFVDKFISLSHRVIVSIDFPLNEQPVEVIARVVWERMTKEGMLIGTKFIDIKKDTKKQLSELLETEMWTHVGAA
jgi:c-di-GMP-binding flagellar brake protein YcgR